MKKFDVLIVIKEPLEKAPPIYNIALKFKIENYSVKIITGSCNSKLIYDLKNEGIEVKTLDVSLKTYTGIKIIDTLLFWFKFRFSAIKEINKTKFSILYIATGDTAISLMFYLNKFNFYVHLRELYDTNKIYLFLLNKISKFAINIIVPEKNRALIYKQYFKLNQLPIVIPNRSINHPRTLKQDISFLDPKIQEQIKSKKNFIFQGIISKQRDLSNFLKSLRNHKEYNLILMGEDYGILESYKKIYPNLIHIPFQIPPRHLNVTSWADIGIITYDFSDLNHIYCAPNKLYEYSGFGLPILCSENPGIKSPVESNSIGISVDFTDDLKISKSISSIISKANFFSKKSTEFYENSDYCISKKIN